MVMSVLHCAAEERTATMTAMHPIVVEKVVKHFQQGRGDVTALNGVDLTVRRGQFIAIMGASGSGKSTLLHLMAGLTTADSGRVLIDGADLALMNDRRLTHFRGSKIGLIFQSFNLIPTLTAAQNIALPLRLAGRDGKEAAAKAQAVLDRMRLSHRADHRPDALSGGEQQRVAIGRALVTEPAVILADEPTGNLDSSNSRDICHLLAELSREEQATIVMVTHEPSVAIYAGEVVFIKDGLIADRQATAQIGDAAALAIRYQQILGASAGQSAGAGAGALQ